MGNLLPIIIFTKTSFIFNINKINKNPLSRMGNPKAKRQRKLPVTRENTILFCKQTKTHAYIVWWQGLIQDYILLKTFSQK